MSDLPILQAIAAPDEEPHDPATVPPSGGPDCPNCGARLRGRYCGSCGQLDQPLRLPVHRFLSQSVTEFFGIDGRVWKTLGLLLFRPGALTEAYLSGQRRRYLRPLRVYLSATLLFFFLLSLLDPVGRLERAVVDRSAIGDTTMTAGAYVAFLDAQLAEEADREAQQRALVDSLQRQADRLATSFRADSLAGRLADPDTLDAAREALDDLREEVEDKRDDLDRMEASPPSRMLTWQRTQAAAYPADSLIRPGDLITAVELVLGGDPGPTLELGFDEGLIQRSRTYTRLTSARTSEERAQAGLDLARASIQKVPVVLFLMLPVFALLLKLLYVRRGWYYSEHIVFGLHTHALAFAVFSVLTLVLAAGIEGMWGTGLTTGLSLWIPVYFTLAQKRVYGQGWVKTLAKASLLGVVYMVVLFVVGLTLTVLLAFLST